MKGSRVSVEIKNPLYDSMTCMQMRQNMNEGEKSRIQAVHMSYQRGVCGVNRNNGGNNERLYERFDMSNDGEEMNCRMRRGSNAELQVVWS